MLHPDATNQVNQSTREYRAERRLPYTYADSMRIWGKIRGKSAIYHGWRVDPPRQSANISQDGVRAGSPRIDCRDAS
jgi:hypothetical protein